MYDDMEVMTNLLSEVTNYQLVEKEKHKKAKGVKVIFSSRNDIGYQVLWITSNRIIGFLNYPDMEKHKTHRFPNININF